MANLELILTLASFGIVLLLGLAMLGATAVAVIVLIVSLIKKSAKAGKKEEKKEESIEGEDK